MTLAQSLNAPFRRPPSGPRSERGAKLRAQIEADKRVAFLDVEPTDGWFVTLAPGWSYVGDPGNAHCFGADTLSAAMREIRQSVPCACEQCKLELAGVSRD